jgi:hypothetical protein
MGNCATDELIDAPSGSIAFLVRGSLKMDSLRERIVAYANASANFLAQLNELDELREQVRQAQLSPRNDQATERARQHHRRTRERNTCAARNYTDMTGARLWNRTRMPSASE